jgi:hypothetical protein
MDVCMPYRLSRGGAAIYADIEAVRGELRLYPRLHFTNELKAIRKLVLGKIPYREYMAPWDYERMAPGYRKPIVDGQGMLVTNHYLSGRFAKGTVHGFHPRWQLGVRPDELRGEETLDLN